MESNEQGSGEPEAEMGHIVVEIIEYEENSVSVKTIIRKWARNVGIMTFDSRGGFTVETSPFDTYVKLIKGNAGVVIDNISNYLAPGMGLIIPAHLPNCIKPNGPFKMIQTIINSNDE